jgi:ornithine cyclodeaminase/alanine dehydrogenase
VTRFFDGEVLEAHLTSDLALRAMETCFDAEADGTTKLPPRIDTPTGRGFIRVMPAVLDDVMGCKIMTLVEGSGTRYLVMLYDVATGALLALFDADELTRIRTAAVTTLAGNAMLAAPPEELAIVGTGFEAVGHLRMMAHAWPLRRVFAYSPNPERRARFAAEMSRSLGIEVIAAATEAEALAGRALVVLATKSKAPVIDGNHLAPGCVVLSIGSTRLDLRELDDRSLARASIVVADDPQMIQLESADIAETIAAGLLDPGRIVALSQLRRGSRPALDRGGDVAIFKSVGTALQDLALARAIARDEAMASLAGTLPELTRLKPFAAKAFAPVPASA